MSDVKPTKRGQAMPESAHEAEGLQFPSDEGHEKVENAKRSDAVEDDATSRYLKDFVIAGSAERNADDMHEANEAAVLQEAIQNGVHPKGDVSFDGITDHPDGMSKILRYSVEVVPAHVDDEPGDTVTPTLSDSGE